jgi:hypothetical protein
MWATQCHKPIMTGDGKHSTYKKWWQLVMTWGFYCWVYLIIGSFWYPMIPVGLQVFPWCDPSYILVGRCCSHSSYTISCSNW